MSDNTQVLHDNVPLIYKIMHKCGMSHNDCVGDMGQFIWLQLCKYVHNYNPAKGTLGTWAGWQVWAARIAYLEKNKEYRAKTRNTKNIGEIYDTNDYDSRRDFLEHDKILSTMDTLLKSNHGGVSHREVMRLCLEQEMPYRAIAKQLGVSKARVGMIIELSKAKLREALNEKEELCESGRVR